MKIPPLMSAIANLVFTQELGLAVNHPVCQLFIAIRTLEDLRGLDWGEIRQVLACKASQDALDDCVDWVRLLVDRAEIHAYLYTAKSATTLCLQNKYNLHPSEGLLSLDNFYALRQQADDALREGRAKLCQFEQSVKEDPSYTSLRRILNQAYEHYLTYKHALASMDSCFEVMQEQPKTRRRATLAA